MSAPITVTYFQPRPDLTLCLYRYAKLKDKHLMSRSQSSGKAATALAGHYTWRVRQLVEPVVAQKLLWQGTLLPMPESSMFKSHSMTEHESEHSPIFGAAV